MNAHHSFSGLENLFVSLFYQLDLLEGCVEILKTIIQIGKLLVRQLDR